MISKDTQKRNYSKAIFFSEAEHAEIRNAAAKNGLYMRQYIMLKVRGNKP